MLSFPLKWRGGSLRSHDLAEICNAISLGGDLGLGGWRSKHRLFLGRLLPTPGYGLPFAIVVSEQQDGIRAGR